MRLWWRVGGVDAQETAPTMEEPSADRVVAPFSIQHSDLFPKSLSNCIETKRNEIIAETRRETLEPSVGCSSAATTTTVMGD